MTFEYMNTYILYIIYMILGYESLQSIQLVKPSKKTIVTSAFDAPHMSFSVFPNKICWQEMM